MTSQPLANSRLFWLLPLCLQLLLAATSASGQRFLNAVSLDDDPTSDGWSVEVDHDLVRSGPQRLEFAAPDGRVLAAEMRIFEDRGDGNAMWTGGYPELGYDSVVLTLQDGYLLGRFGLPEGGTYWIRAGSDGFGRLTEGQGSSQGFCGGGVVPETDPLIPAVEAQRADPPGRVSRESNHDRLDILILYTASAAQRLEQANWGTPQAAMQHGMDYLNLVLRNGEIPVTANMVHHEQAPGTLDGVNSPLGPLTDNQDVRDLRAEHDADLVHLFFNESPGFCGQAWLLQRRHTARTFSGSGYGVTTVAGGCVDNANLVRDGEYGSQIETFAHEVGHNLGGNHDPDNTDVDPSDAVEPFAYGHHHFDSQPEIKSVMSYSTGRQEPYFSTVRIRPRGWTLGVADQRENERAIQRTIHIAVQYSDFLTGGTEPPPPPSGPRPTAPGNLKVMRTSAASVKLTWVDESSNEDGFEVQNRPEGGRWQTAMRLPHNTEAADIDGLVSGGRHDFRVRAFNSNGGSNSNTVTIVLPTFSDCVPSAAQITFEHGYTVSMCIEYENQDGGTVKADAWNYGLELKESGILYFFDRDNAEVLVKVLDTCAISDYVWVYVAPVTDLAFNLYVDETATEKRWMHRNPRGRATATTRSDNQAFPCEASGSTANATRGGDGAPGVELVDSGFPATWAAGAASASDSTGSAPNGVAQPIGAGEGTDCEPTPVTTLGGGYTVNMCVEYLDSATGEPTISEAQDYGLDSLQSGLLYFFNSSNAEVLIKVLDSSCAISDYVWVYVAPVTDLAFNLTVVSPNPEDEVWKHSNVLSRTAAAKSDNQAFPCSN